MEKGYNNVKEITQPYPHTSKELRHQGLLNVKINLVTQIWYINYAICILTMQFVKVLYLHNKNGGKEVGREQKCSSVYAYKK